MSRLFGTDGIRGEAGQPPLDPSTLVAIGHAIAGVLGRRAERPPRIAIGRDTRESGPDIVRSLASGLRAGGAIVRSAGVLPTPGVSFLARSAAFDAGVVVSASHNPWRDNGLKIFAHDGTKLPDDLEREVEDRVARGAPPAAAAGEALPDEPALGEAYADWLAALARETGAGRSGMVACVDCANGAASTLAPAVLSAAGLRPIVLHAAPDGRNINLDCGSLHVDGLVEAVLRERADIGIAFDGDADRALFVDHRGALVDGDHVLLIVADALRSAGRLAGGGVVGTVMSNLGLEQALRRRGLSLVRERVGDRFIVERLRSDGYNLGGEPSGHVVLLDDAPTGDGIVTALRVLGAVASSGRKLADLAGDLERAPQVLRNVRVRSRVPLEDVPGYGALEKAWRDRLADDGRIVVRYSGTERLLRVMVEGSDAPLVESCADDLAGHLVRELGDAS